MEGTPPKRQQAKFSRICSSATVCARSYLPRFEYSAGADSQAPCYEMRLLPFVGHDLIGIVRPLRPVGQQSVTFNPLDNDNDKGDGKFGLVLNPDGSYGPAVDWATFYPVEIVDQPSLGKIYGASSGLCPGSAAVPKICVNPPLRYVADNNMSPFTDTFSYHVYDQDGQTSNSATVSIYTNAPDPDHGGGQTCSR